MKPNLVFGESKITESRQSLNHHTRKQPAFLTRFVVSTGAVITLFAFEVTQAASSGPASGGNTLTINGTALGNGSDITNVTTCGVVAAIQSQTANSVTVVTGRADDGGTGDIRVYSASVGVTTFTNGYTYNPPGSIFGSFIGWSRVSDLPAGRLNVAAASVNGKIYAVGGYDSTSPFFFPTVYLYDPAKPMLGWLSVSNLPAARGYSAAVSVNGKIYSIGGFDTNINPQSSVYVYDPLQASLGWLNVSNLPAARAYLAAASVNGKIYAIGGADSSTYKSTAFVYDPSQPTLGWMSVSNLPAGRGALAAASVNGKIYAIGGYDGTNYQSTVYVYDPSQPALGWLSVSNLSLALGYLAAANVNDKIYAIGGYNSLYLGLYAFSVYDPAQPTLGWLSENNPQMRRGLASASVNGKIYAIGGLGNDSPPYAVYEGSFASGMVPSSGPLTGGNTVTINGNNLGSGDVTGVTICGIPAAILTDNSPTQIVVNAGLGTIPTNGDVVVNSISYGVTVKSNAYAYLPPVPTALAATNITLNSFYPIWDNVNGATNYLLDVSTTNNFVFCITGYTNLSVGNGTTFWVSGLSAGTVYYYRLRCQQNGLTSDNSITISVQTLGGTSMNNGPAVGGNTLTITGAGLGNGSDITNVTICGVAAVIQSQTANSVTVVVATGASGTGDIKVYSASLGVTTFANGYTYNPPGYVFGPFMGWVSISNLPAARADLAAVSVNGKIYAIAGYNGNTSPYVYSNVYVYAPTQPTQGWLSVSNLPVACASLAAASVNGKIYAIGGSVNGVNSLSTVYVYDPAQPMLGWLSVSNLPAPRSSLAAVSVNGKIYAIGGFYNYSSWSTVYVYDPSQPTLGWLSVSNLPDMRKDLAAVSVNGKIYAIGGYSDTYPYEQSTVYVYDPAQPTLGWLRVSNLPAVRENLAAVSVNGRIFAIGGDDGSAQQSTVYAYDPARPTLGWLSASNLPVVRSRLAAASVNDKIYAIGGYNGSSGYQSTVYEGSFATGVVPSSGPLAGGNTVTINGSNLGAEDVMSVTLCGIPAALLTDNSPNQVVVSAGTAAVPITGDVVVNSTSYGVTIKSNGYTYLPSSPTALAATDITLNSFCANWSSVNDATNYLLDVSTTNNFISCVTGYTNLSVGNVTTFNVTGLNAEAVYYYRVRCQQNGLTSGNSLLVSVQTLGGISVNNGPAAGGNTLTISGVALGNGSDITNVMICGVAAAIQSQTANSVTVVLGVGGVGIGNIVVNSAGSGVTTFVNGYTYNPLGSIFGPLIGWSGISNLPTARDGLAAVSINSKIYVIGGYDGTNSKSTVFVYDPAHPALGWLSISNLPTILDGLAAIGVNSKIYAIGGTDGTNYQSSVYVYDPSQPTQGWLGVSNLPAQRAGLAAADANSKIYAIGGSGKTFPYYFSTVYLYDPSQPTLGWSSVSNLPVASYGLAAAAVNGKLYAIGGNYSGSYFSTVCVYDSAQPALSWMSVSNLPTAIGFLAAVAVNGRIYAIGGYDGSGIVRSAVYVYDPTQPTLGWLSVSNLPAGREGLAAVSVNGRIYAIGGRDEHNCQSTVFEGSFAPDIAPPSGPLVGGNTVTINGIYLGRDDVTSVTLCGVPASIVSDNSPTQIVVRAGATANPVTGDVVVNSTSYGVTVKSNAYTYFQSPTINIMSFDGTHLQLSWPTNCLGWELQAQTNPLGAGIGTNWSIVATSTSTNQLLILINQTNPSGFYRLHQQ